MKEANFQARHGLGTAKGTLRLSGHILILDRRSQWGKSTHKNITKKQGWQMVCGPTRVTHFDASIPAQAWALNPRAAILPRALIYAWLMRVTDVLCVVALVAELNLLLTSCRVASRTCNM
jgi:hypothetical protein